MSDFRARIVAELDTSKIPSSIKKIEKQNITLRNFSLDTKGLPSQIQASLDKHKFTIKLDGIKTSNIDIATGGVKKSVNDIQLAYNDLMKMQKRISSIRLNLAGLDSSKNSSQITALRNQLSSVDTEYKHLLATFQKDLSPIQLDNLEREFQLTSEKIAVVSAKAKDAAKNIATPVSSLQAMTLDNKMSTWLEKNSKASKDFGNSIDLLRNKLSTLNASGKLTTDEFKSIQNEFKLIQQQAIATGGVKKSVNDIQLAYNDLMKMQKRISSIRLNLAGLDSSKNSSQITALRNQLSSVDTEYKHLLATFQKDLSPIQLDNLEREFQLTSEKIAVVSAKAKDAAKNIATPVSSLQAMTLDNKMSTWLEKNSKASKDFGNSIDLLRNKLSTLNASGKLTTDEFKSIQNEFKLIQQQAIATGKIGRSFSSTFAGAFRSILQYVNVSTIIYQSISGLKQMFQNVVDIDTAMTELKKVTNETAESYSKFLSNAGTSAKEIGTTVTGIIESTADFARLGYSFTDSQELAKTANIYAVVGDEIENVDVATKSIISTLAAYKDEISDSMQIADKFNEVGNNFAISSGGIGDALQRSASSLAAANNSLDQSIALITAANTVVQDPDAVGKQMLPTIKITISVKSQRWSRPRKDFVDIVTRQLGRACFYYI